MPLDQSEALWVWFSSPYHFAVKAAVGEIDALSGAPWTPYLQRQPQNYLVVPDAGWRKCSEIVRQFVAMPLRARHSVTTAMDQASRDGVQLQISPLCAESCCRKEANFFVPPTIQEFFMRLIFGRMISAQLAEIDRRAERLDNLDDPFEELTQTTLEETSRPEIYEDPYQFTEWDQKHTVRCVVQACDSVAWRQITGANPPRQPLTAREYLQAGIPWLNDYRDDSQPLPEDSSITPDRIFLHGNTRRLGEIREFLDTP